MASPKKNKSKKKSPQPTFNPITATVAPPPSVTVPAPPLGYNPDAPPLPRGGRAIAALIAAAAGVVQELNAAPSFAQDLGTKIPASEIVDMLLSGVAWRHLRNASMTWTNYVKNGDAQAWITVRQELERVRMAFDAAAAVDQTLPQRYPALNALFQAMSAPAQKAVVTRRKNAKAAASSEQQSQIPAPASPAVAVHPAPAVTPPAPSA